MLKLYSKRQATRKNERREYPSGKRLLNFTYFVLIISLCVWGWQLLKNPQTLPIEKIQVIGNYELVNPQRLQKAVAPYVHAGFFNVDIAAIKQNLQTLPWVKSVAVYRVWPHTLLINMAEEDPIARWGDNAFINSQGQIFNPGINNNRGFGLPLLLADTNNESLALTYFKQFSEMLSSLNLSINQLQISSGQLVQITLSNGIQVLLGKTDVIERLQRFIAVYTKVLASKATQIEYADMRYTNGMAINWKDTKSLSSNFKGGK